MSHIEYHVKTGRQTFKIFYVGVRRRQFDALACMMFNQILEKALRDAGVGTRGSIFNRPT